MNRRIAKKIAARPLRYNDRQCRKAFGRLGRMDWYHWYFEPLEWKNYTATYTNQSPTDLIPLMREAWGKVNVQPPISVLCIPFEETPAENLQVFEATNSSGDGPTIDWGSPFFHVWDCTPMTTEENTR